MALSQIQCLDDNHVNPRTSESKPDFLYCEDQRLALEALLRDGREAFFQFLEARGLRGFLSDPELETLAGTVEPYDPGSELFPGSAEDGEPPLSLHYWPDLSDTSVPRMDLGWPDVDAYRGVTRTTVYSQPPLDGQTHIKEVVRKMIAQAQKVIAVVMDVFTDVDIFRDLLDAGFKRRISVYILLERTTLPHFLSMCQRANMHAGHLKHLRVRCTEGVEFYTRSSTKVRGRMGHRFMFIDGDKTVSGSYSFTWMSSRLERNLVSVITGQAVDAFDRLFRFLYATSSSVDLRQVAMDTEPEPEPLPQPATVVPPSAALARKLYNPKYALVTLGNPSPSPSPTPSPGHNSSKETPNPEVPDTKKRRRRRPSKEAIQEGPPIHPGLTNLEKACLMSYLPTWPEPDPPSDVIGFINVRDSRKPTQVHLQRSEMFETSQAIRFSSPFTMPKKTLPEVAKPRQLTAKHEEINKLQPAQDKTKAEDSAVDRAQPTRLSSGTGDIKSKAEAPASGLNCGSAKDTTKTLNTENKPHSSTATNQDAGHNTTPHLNSHAPPQSSSKASTPNTGKPLHTTQTVTTNSPEPNSLPRSNTKKEAETSLNTQHAVVYRTHTLESNSTQAAGLRGPTDSNTGENTQTKTVLPYTDSHTHAVHTQPQNSTEMTPNIQTPTPYSHVSPSSTSAVCPQPVSSTSISQNNHISFTTSTSTSARAPLSSRSSSPSRLPLTSSSTTLNPPLPSSSASSPLTSAPPIPKPRTIQLVVKDGVTSDGQKLPEFTVARRPETSTGPLVVHNDPAVATVVQTSPRKKPETVPEQQNKSGSKTGAQKDAENTGNIGDAPQQKHSGTSRMTKNEEAVGLNDARAGVQLVAETNLEAQSDVLITAAPKEESVNTQPETLTSIDCKLTPQTETKAPEKKLTGCEFARVPNEISKDMMQRKAYCARAYELQRISYRESTPQDVGVSEPVDSFKAPTHTPASATHNSHVSKDGAGDSALIPKARGSAHTPEKSLRLHLSDTNMPNLRSATPERESRSLTALMRTPTPDGFLPRTPTPDSRTHTPDPRSHTPDFRTPTPDVSDGYVSPLSTTSEEYYECSDSPYHEPVFDQAAYRNHRTTEDHVSFTHTNTPPNATTITTSPACINKCINTCAATLGAADRNTSSSETQSLSGPARVSSSSSLLEKKVKTGEEEVETANEENGREEDEKGGKLNAAERRSGEEAKRTADHFKQGKDSTDKVEKNKEAQPQAPKRKRVLNQSAAGGLVDGGVTPGELTNEGAETKRLSTGDLKPKKVSAVGERPDKEKAVDRAALGPGAVERRDRPQSTRESEGQKLLHTPPRPPRGQQQDSGGSSPSRPSRPLRPLSATQHLGPRPWTNRQLNQAESKVLQGSSQVLDNTSSPRRPSSRPPAPVAANAVGSAAGRKPAEVSHSQQGLPSRQPPAAQGTTRPGQSLNLHPNPKPQASFLHTHSNAQSQLRPHSQNQTASAQEAPCQKEEKAPFSFTFSRLYSLKGLKDKMSKLPAQGKRGSTGSPVQGRKSTS